MAKRTQTPSASRSTTAASRAEAARRDRPAVGTPPTTTTAVAVARPAVSVDSRPAPPSAPTLGTRVAGWLLVPVYVTLAVTMVPVGWLRGTTTGRRHSEKQ
jgi:hypothetical protein